MIALELKFLLRLLGFARYRAPIAKLTLNARTSARDRDRICHQLRDRGWVDIACKVKRFQIAPPGRALLQLLSNNLPLTNSERQILQFSARRQTPLTPGKIQLPPAQRQPTLHALAERGLIQITEQAITEVWLTERGQHYLRYEYQPNGTATLSLTLLGHYLKFLRHSPWEAKPVAEVAGMEEQGIRSGRAMEWGSDGAGESISPPSPLGDAQPTSATRSQTQNSKLKTQNSSSPHTPEQTHRFAPTLPNPETLLQSIQTLDNELGTANYLPIFHLRQQWPDLDREDLDRLLYQLQRQDAIELSSLQESLAYTAEQRAAGIPQEIGGPLFFISVAT